MKPIDGRSSSPIEISIDPSRSRPFRTVLEPPLTTQSQEVDFRLSPSGTGSIQRVSPSRTKQSSMQDLEFGSTKIQQTPPKAPSSRQFDHDSYIENL